MDQAAIYERIAGSVARQSAMTTLGARLVEAKKGSVTFEMLYAEHILQQHGFIHGGVVATIADSACGYAALTMFEADRAVLTTEFKIHFLSPAQGEKFLAIGKVIKPGRQISVTQSDVYAVTGESTKHIATMLATMMSIEKRPGMVD